MSVNSLLKMKAPGRSDHFQTPASTTATIMPFLNPKWKIWEPACGDGQIVETLRAGGFEVAGTDILNGFDFLSPLAHPGIAFDCICTNPPYSTKDQWLERCFDIGKPFALLLPITALGEQGRIRIYKKHGIQMVMPPNRTDFKTPNGKQGGAWFYAAWFCHGLDLPSQITFA